MPQYVFHITAGEMDSVDFRLVLGEVLIMLLLPGLEQNHVSGSDLLYLVAKEKNRFFQLLHIAADNPAAPWVARWAAFLLYAADRFRSFLRSGVWTYL